MSWYFDHLDLERLRREYPMGDAFPRAYAGMADDELRALQDARFRRVVACGWRTPFYRSLWGAVGLEPGDVRGLDDLHRLPTYEKGDLMAAVEELPPYGGLIPDPEEGRPRPPVVLHTTSGTTGTPQPLLFGPWGREVANLLVARLYRWLGVTDDDVVHSVYGHGLVNGGHYLRESVIHFTGATFLSAGTGVETPSIRQVETMQRFGATVLIGFVDYLRRLAEVAREAGLEPGRELPVRMLIGHLAADARETVEAAWGGAPAFDWYGVADTGSVAGEGPLRDGLHVWEDAHLLEILDADGRAVPAGVEGDMVVTCLYKDDVAPVIRFDTHDVSAWLPGASASGLPFRRIRGFLGRSDNMVKLRGINVYPHALAQLLDGDAALTGEYVCRVARSDAGRDEMTVVLEHRAGAEAGADERERLATHLRAQLGVAVLVELVAPGATAPLTQVEARQKPIRLLDAR